MRVCGGWGRIYAPSSDARLKAADNKGWSRKTLYVKRQLLIKCWGEGVFEWWHQAAFTTHCAFSKYNQRVYVNVCLIIDCYKWKRTYTSNSLLVWIYGGEVKYVKGRNTHSSFIHRMTDKSRHWCSGEMKCTQTNWLR